MKQYNLDSKQKQFNYLLSLYDDLEDLRTLTVEVTSAIKRDDAYDNEYGMLVTVNESLSAMRNELRKVMGATDGWHKE